ISREQIATGGSPYFRTGGPLLQLARDWSLLHKWTFALLDGEKCVGTSDCAYDLVVVPRVLGFPRSFHLHEVHVVDHTAILPNLAIGGKKVVHLHFAHLRRNLV